jgi:hypothetical protein
MKPHKHAELIKQWADGAEIEWKFDETGTWMDFNDGHGFYNGAIYRIKPEENKPVVRWKCVYKSANGYWTETNYFYTDEEIKQCKGHTKLEYTRQEFPE